MTKVEKSLPLGTSSEALPSSTRATDRMISSIAIAALNPLSETTIAAFKALSEIVIVAFNALSKTAIAAFKALSKTAASKELPKKHEGALIFTTGVRCKTASEELLSRLDSVPKQTTIWGYLPTTLEHDRFEERVPEKCLSELNAYKQKIHLFVCAFIEKHYVKPIPEQITLLHAECKEVIEKHFGMRQDFIFSQMFIDNVKRYFIREQVHLLKERVVTDAAYKGVKGDTIEPGIEALSQFAKISRLREDDFICYWSDFSPIAGLSRSSFREAIRKEIFTPPTASKEVMKAIFSGIEAFNRTQNEIDPLLQTTLYASKEEAGQLHRKIEYQESILRALKMLMDSLNPSQRDEAADAFSNGASLLEILDRASGDYSSAYERRKSFRSATSSTSEKTSCSSIIRNSIITLQFGYALLSAEEKASFQAAHPELDIILEYIE